MSWDLDINARQPKQKIWLSFGCSTKTSQFLFPWWRCVWSVLFGNKWKLLLYESFLCSLFQCHRSELANSSLVPLIWQYKRLLSVFQIQVRSWKISLGHELQEMLVVNTKICIRSLGRRSTFYSVGLISLLKRGNIHFSISWARRNWAILNFSRY